MSNKYGYTLRSEGVDIDSAHLAHIKSVLAFQRTPAEKAQKDKLQNAFDVNGNQLLSFTEIDKGLRDVLHLDENLFHAKRAIMVAFQSAKLAAKHKSTHSEDYVNRYKFRILLKYLWQYFELYSVFTRMEEGGDVELSKVEFIKNYPLLEKIVGAIGNPEEVWKEFKVGQHGHVVFSDFAKWGHARMLASGDEE